MLSQLAHTLGQHDCEKGDDVQCREFLCQNSQAQKQPGGEDSSSEPAGQELNYAARISLDQTSMQIDDKMVALSPGMAVTTEIKTGERTIITYLLSPRLKFRQESLRER